VDCLALALDGYLTGQNDWLVNYAERHRAGLRVGTAITEGTANFLVNRRMNKSHMWSAHSSQGIVAFDQIACVHMSGLLVRSHMNADQDGFRDTGSKQQSDL
jgi:hypothetical protein